MSPTKLTFLSWCKWIDDYVGHKVGQGQVKPIMASMKAIEKFSAHDIQIKLMRFFLEIIWFYRKLCSNFAIVVYVLVHPLINPSKLYGIALTRELRCSGRPNSFCSTSCTRPSTLAKNPVLSHNWWNAGIVVMTNWTYWWSVVVTQISHNGQPRYDRNSKISEVMTSKLPWGTPVSVALSALIFYQANHDMNQRFRIIVSNER